MLQSHYGKTNKLIYNDNGVNDLLSNPGQYILQCSATEYTEQVYLVCFRAESTISPIFVVHYVSKEENGAIGARAHRTTLATTFAMSQSFLL